MHSLCVLTFPNRAVFIISQVFFSLILLISTIFASFTLKKLRRWCMWLILQTAGNIFLPIKCYNEYQTNVLWSFIWLSASFHKLPNQKGTSFGWPVANLKLSDSILVCLRLPSLMFNNIPLFENISCKLPSFIVNHQS